MLVKLLYWSASGRFIQPSWVLSQDEMSLQITAAHLSSFSLHCRQFCIPSLIFTILVGNNRRIPCTHLNSITRFLFQRCFKCQDGYLLLLQSVIVHFGIFSGIVAFLYTYSISIIIISNSDKIRYYTCIYLPDGDTYTYLRQIQSGIV